MFLFWGKGWGGGGDGDGAKPNIEGNVAATCTRVLTVRCKSSGIDKQE